jgi:hypothetical protein
MISALKKTGETIAFVGLPFRKNHPDEAACEALSPQEGKICTMALMKTISTLRACHRSGL